MNHPNGKGNKTPESGTGGWTRGELLKVSGSYWAACTLHAAVILDVFSLLGNERLSADEVSTRLGAKGRGTQMLLNALTAMNLLTRQDGLFSNTTDSNRYLRPGSDEYTGDIIRHHHFLVEGWSRLHESVLSGKPARPDRVADRGGDQLEAFLMGMFNLASGLAPRLVPTIDMTGRKKLLDLGGGPGTYAVHFCRHNPGLSALVYDLPTTRDFAERTIARFNMGDRVSFLEGDYLEDDLPGGFDAAWLSHVLHGEGPNGCATILKKVAAALDPGGLLLIHEFILDDTMDGPLHPALFSLNMLLGTPEGRAYSESQLAAMMREAGLSDIRRLPFTSPAQTGIMAGEKA